MWRQVISIMGINLLFITNAMSFNSNDSTYIVIHRDRKQMQVYCGNTLLHTYKIAIGKKVTPTPVGEFKIVNKIENPTWYPTGKPPVEKGEQNPLGTRWLGLDKKGYGIHGTNVPSSIGKSASHGCIRMKKQDVEELFQLISVGTSVVIQDTTIQNNGLGNTYVTETGKSTLTLPASYSTISTLASPQQQASAKILTH